MQVVVDRGDRCGEAHRERSLTIKLCLDVVGLGAENIQFCKYGRKIGISRGVGMRCRPNGSAREIGVVVGGRNRRVVGGTACRGRSRSGRGGDNIIVVRNIIGNGTTS